MIAKRALAIVLVAAATAACGGGDKPSAVPESTPAATVARDLADFVLKEFEVPEKLKKDFSVPGPMTADEFIDEMDADSAESLRRYGLERAYALQYTTPTTDSNAATIFSFALEFPNDGSASEAIKDSERTVPENHSVTSVDPGEIGQESICFAGEINGMSPASMCGARIDNVVFYVMVAGPGLGASADGAIELANTIEARVA